MAGQQRDMGELKKEAEGGKVEAQFELGFAYFFGDGVPESSPEAAKWFVKAADQGHPLAQAYLGLQYFFGTGLPKDEARGRSLAGAAKDAIFRIAEEGNVAAQVVLGRLFEGGVGVPRDEAKAVEWFRKAAEQGLAVAQNGFGQMY